MRARSLMVGMLATVLLAVVPAGAGVSVHAEKYFMPILGGGSGAQPASGSGNLINHGGPVQTVPAVYLVFWGWDGIDPSGEAPYLQAFFNGVGGSSWANIHTQYSGITNPSGQLKGVWFDNSASAIAESASPDLFIDSEALNAAAHFGYSANADYIIATPHLRNDAEFGVVYCAWHSYATDGLGRKVAYTDLPYIPDAQLGTCGENFVNPGAAGALDGVSIVAGHEYTEAVTDPHLDAWYDASGEENADKCAWNGGPGAHAQNIVLSTGTFAVQASWSNAISACAITYP